MSDTFTALFAHVVFATKERRNTIQPEIRARLHAYLGGIVRNLGATAIEIDGTADHVHIVIQYPSRLAIADIVCKVKSYSSRWVHETYPDQRGFAWQNGYAAFSISESRVAAVRRYVRRQEEHHKRMTFGEEIEHLLERASSDSHTPAGVCDQPAVKGAGAFPGADAPG